jgi:hypothetical protein
MYYKHWRDNHREEAEEAEKHRLRIVRCKLSRRYKEIPQIIGGKVAIQVIDTCQNSIRNLAMEYDVEDEEDMRDEVRLLLKQHLIESGLILIITGIVRDRTRIT